MANRVPKHDDDTAFAVVFRHLLEHGPTDTRALAVATGRRLRTVRSEVLVAEREGLLCRVGNGTRVGPHGGRRPALWGVVW